MRRNRRHSPLRLLPVAAAGALLACVAPLPPHEEESEGGEGGGTEAAEIDLEFSDYNLEADQGGMDGGDEEPGFGRRGFAEELGEDVPGPDGVAERPDPDAIYLRILWGQLRGNPEAPCGLDWTGGLFGHRLGIRLERVIRFEGRDEILPRERPEVLEWISHTRPHFDGVLVSLRARRPEVRPEPADGARPEAADEGEVEEGVVRLPALTFSTEPLTETFTLRELADLDLVVPVDRCGNAVSFQALPAPPGPPCRRGFMHGRWRPRDDGRGGVFGGKVETVLGHLVGHMRGVYGVRDGDRIFFGKVVDLGGRFIGFLRGTWEVTEPGLGRYRGVWLAVGGGQHGVLGGHWRALPDVPGGVFHGRWSELCELPLCEDVNALPGEEDPALAERPREGEDGSRPERDAEGNDRAGNGEPADRPQRDAAGNDHDANGERPARPERDAAGNDPGDGDNGDRPDGDADGIDREGEHPRPDARPPFDLIRRRIVGGQAGIDATLDVLGVGHAVLKVAHAHARCLRVERARLTPEELQALVQALEGFGQLEPAYSCGELAGGEILDAPDVVFQVRRGEAAKRVRVADAVCWDRLPEPLVELTAALDRLVQAHFRNRPAAQDEAGRVE